jgi:hypothetical protein
LFCNIGDFFFFGLLLINLRKMLHGGSLPLLIQKEEEVTNLIKEKGVGSPIIDPEQTKIVLKYIQKVRNGTNK